MKFVRKKIIKDHEYYYFEHAWKAGSKRFAMSQYLGSELPADLSDKLQNYFKEIAQRATENTDGDAKKYFLPKPVFPIEEGRFWYQSLHNELFENDLRLFRSLFAILFILNSNRAEGSKVTRKNIEKLMQRRQKPKTPLDFEILNSLAALKFAFSRNMKWNTKSIKILHRLLFDHLSPEMAGRFKKENVIINNESTTDWKFAKKELGNLLQWFRKNKKKYYPPLFALEFHHRFERIHPFLDGNGRIGRLLFNAFLLQSGYMPVIFFSENHRSYCTAISQARLGRKKKLAYYFIKQIIKTKKAIQKYKREGIVRGGSPQVGRWEIEHGKIRKY